MKKQTQRRRRFNRPWQLVIVGFVLVALSILVISVMRISRPTQTSAQPVHDSVKAIDSANTVTDPKWFSQVYEAGFRLYIMHATSWGTCDPWVNTESQLRMALDAGLKVAIYTRDPRCWQTGIEAAGAYKDKLQFFALDIESNPGVPATRAMVDGVKALGVRPVIYTGQSMWTRLQSGQEDGFKDIPLWDTQTSTLAYSDWSADYLSPQPTAYGGWNTADNMRIGVQQEFEHNLFGIYVDLNSFDSQFLK